jgi:hypothetical protein
MKNQEMLTVLDPRGQPSGVFGRRIELNASPGDILDPNAQPSGAVVPVRMAPRLKSLNGKTVYLVDTGFAGSHDFMNEVNGWFARNRPEVKTVVKKKQGSIFTDDPDLWVEIKAKGDAVIFGVGG